MTSTKPLILFMDETLWRILKEGKSKEAPVYTDTDYAHRQGADPLVVLSVVEPADPKPLPPGEGAVGGICRDPEVKALLKGMQVAELNLECKCTPISVCENCKSESPKPEAVSDEEAADHIADRVINTNRRLGNDLPHNAIRVMCALDGIAEGRKREREERAFPEMSAKHTIHPNALIALGDDELVKAGHLFECWKTREQREEAAAREAWEAAFDQGCLAMSGGESAKAKTAPTTTFSEWWKQFKEGGR